MSTDPEEIEASKGAILAEALYQIDDIRVEALQRRRDTHLEFDKEYELGRVDALASSFRSIYRLGLREKIQWWKAADDIDTLLAKYDLVRLSWDETFQEWAHIYKGDDGFDEAKIYNTVDQRYP